ncbi:MAG TPA: hypothetical protein VMS94_05240 [Acidobacteriota bacterium]|nr:hypothetical protein [Acidobacteriota bacterium]
MIMHYKCRDVNTSEVVFVDTDSELDVGDVFYFRGRALKVVREINRKSQEAERIPCDDLKLILNVR